MSGCTFKDGWSDEAGGAIYNAGTASLDYVEVKENNARVGGGIYNSSDMQISNSLIWSNNTTIHGTDIANKGSLTNTTTEEQYNTWLNKYNLYYAGWYDDTNTSIGGAGDYMKFLTTTEAPSVEEPTEPTAPTEETEEPSSPEPEEPTTPKEEQPTEPLLEIMRGKLVEIALERGKISLAEMRGKQGIYRQFQTMAEKVKLQLLLVRRIINQKSLALPPLLPAMQIKRMFLGGM